MKTPLIRSIRPLSMLSLLVMLLVGCGSPQYVRDTEEPRLDEYTMSLRFDRQDLDRLYQENIDELLTSRIVRQWDRGESPVVAIFPMRNETSEHIGPQLDTLLSKFETDLVNQTAASVVSWESQPDLLNEVRRQQSDAYDPTRLAAYGRQMGAQYFVTGKVYDVAERIHDERRVQYFMFVQVINVSTGQIHFQNESEITKGLIR
ncbi:penicillin-binding protein activator LpoB [Lujinxingia litoralis]|uniref:Penicillin-binding protein activator LpoB n=1 Tax=Lujinxingia litoralis TaxID=2211119 RepID=A0A328C3W2_9DELT|nr:penicillin-binding protein activator LpoB [Lujinxingia litoralis]RAL20427.1 penicillin-binding protein activator LpoB [Lujinxingia litoralis]